MKVARLFPVLAATLVCVGCGSKIEGETDKMPPAGGPKASADRPPGEVPGVGGQTR